MYLELLEDRLAPAVLHWTGAALDTTAFVPGGLTGNYYDSLSGVGPGATLNPTNVNSLFQVTATATALTPFIDFPDITAQGFKNRGTPTPLFTPASPNNDGALFLGEIYLSHLGKYTFFTASDDGSILWLDATSNVDLTGAVKVVANDAFQGRTTKSGTYTNTSIGLHTIAIGYYNGGGGSNMTAFWDPTGGTNQTVIPSSVLYNSAPASKFSNVGNWLEAAAPANGDTIVFDSSTAGFKASTPAINDILNLSLNTITVNNGAATPAPIVMAGNAVTITNSISNFSLGVAGTSDGPTTTIGFDKVTLGANTVITNTSAGPLSTSPTLQISSPIDLAGKTLTSGSGGTTDTGLTVISGVISSSVPGTDHVIENGGGFLALTGTNTFDTAAQVTQGILVDAGTQSLGAVGATVSGPTAFLGISQGDGGTYSTGVTLATGASIIKVDNSSPTVSFPIILTGNATIADGVGANRATGNPNFNGTINLGTKTLTIDINAGAGVTGAPIPAMFFNAPITGLAGSAVTKVGVGRAKLTVDNPALVAAINVNGGFLSVASNNALGAGANVVTVASGASLAFEGAITTPAAQGVTVSGTGVGGHGALYSWASNNTFAGPITVATGDLYVGGTGGNTVLSAPITLGPDNLVLVGTGGNNITITGVITGAAATTITKSDTGTDTIATNNKATFLGTTSITAGVLNITADGALGNGAITEAGGSLGLSGGMTYTGPLSLSGAGALGAGSVESLNGTNTITGAITQSAAGSLGAASGATLVLPNAINNSTFDLTLTGRGATNVGGVISGSGGLIKAGTGTATLNAVMAYTGPTTVNGGVLVLGNPNAISAGGNVTVNGGSIGLPDGTTLPASKLVTLNGGAIEAITGNVNSTIAGNVKLTANSFLKSDAGTLTVNGNIDLNGFTMTGEGAGNIVVNGIISGNVTNTPVAGLQGSYYATSELPNGTNDNLLDPNSAGYIGNLVPTSKDVAAQINFTDIAGTGFAPDFPAIKGNNVAAHFVGSILVDTAGPIQFESASDDGSVVFIDGNRVVNNPGGHGAPGPAPFGTATLSAGLHAIEVIYYQGGGGASLVLSWDPTNTNTYGDPSTHLFTASTNAVDKLGSGTMTLNGANTYVGGTNISAGILVAGNATALNPSGAPVNVNGGALGLPAAGGVTLPANQVINLNGGTIENLGGANTIASPLSLSIPSSITSDAGTLTLNGNIQQNVSNLTFAGAGNTIVNGIITSLAGAPGLLESQLNANIDTTSATGSPKYGFDIQLTTTQAEVLGGDGPVLATALHKWGTNDEWIYQGQMAWPNYNNTGIGYLSFAKDIDDDTSIKIDGVSYLFSTSWNTDLGTGIIALPTGYHNVDFRFSNGGGGAGANATNSNGWTGFTNTKGFVYRVDAGPNDPLGTKTGNDVSVNYQIPIDPGDGSLFRQQAPSVIQNGTGTTTFNAANTYAGVTVVTAGTLVAGNVNALGSGDGTFGTGTSVTGGSLALQGNITFPSTEKLTLAGTGANGAGALENLSGNNIVNQVIDLPGDATIGSTAGTLTLNGNITSTSGSPNLTFTGADKIIVNGQIIGGTQILNVTGNYYSGLTTGSGSGLLDPNSTNWIGNYTPQTTAPLVTSIQYADLSNGGTGFIPYTTLKGSNIGALWTGTINITQATPISFLTGSDDGSRMWIDGTGQFNTTGATMVVDNNRDQGLTFRSGGPFTLTPGLHTIAIAWYNGGGGANMFADWDLSGQTPASYVSGATSGTAIPYALPGVVNVSKTGSGTVTLAAASNSYSGSTTIGGGVLQANGDVSLGSIAKAPITIGAGTLEIMSGASYSSTHPYVLTDPTSTILVDGSAETVTIPGVVSGPGNLNKTGPGGIVLGGSNPYTGGTTDTKGTITVTNAGGLGSGTITMAGGLLSLNVANPARQATLASATGWTKDVIWANSEASPISGTNSGLDIPGPASGGYVFYEQGSLFAPSNTGLPHNGVITSATSGISYQLQPYTASNDLRLPGPGTTGTLTLAAASAANPNVFKSLSFLDLAANGGDATYSATINFVDGGAATVFTGLVAPDMAGNTPAAITNLGRIKTNGSASYDTAGHGQMFDQTITLAAADSVRVVKSIFFTETASTTTNPAKLQIMAVSGLENFTSLGLSNSVNVTADSEIDVATNAATFGPLSVGSNKLTVGGTAAATFGATTLTGNPTLSPATGQTATVGAVGGAGFLNTTGPGTTNLGTIGTGVTLGGSGTFANLVTVGAGGAVNPGSAAGLIGLLTPSGGITFQAGSTDNVELASATSNDQISSGGTITLGNAVLNVTAVNGFTVGTGQTFTIIKNTGGNAIVGTFLGLPENAGVSVGGQALQISYVGGSGHDVVLKSVVHGPATHLSASATQTTVDAGIALGILVTALDTNNLPAAGFTDTLHFTSTDLAATLPADSTISNSSGTFNVTFHTAGSQTVTVTDVATGNTVTASTTAPVNVNPVILKAVNFLVTGPATSSPGSTVTLTVTARDANNNSTTNYTGMVHITDTDTGAGAVLPPDATLTNGVGTFQVKFGTPAPASGVVTITASDSVSAGITGTTAVSVGIVTNVPGASVLTVVPSTTTPATNTGFDVTVTALDKQNAVVTTGYTDAVTLTSNDPLAKSLGSHTFVAADQGKFIFHNVKLKTNGSETITALDTVSTNPIVTGSTVVNAAGLTAVIAKTPTGFTATFNQAINPKDLTIVGAAGTTADVTMVGAAGAMPGTLVLNATDTVATFNVTGNFLVASSPSGTAALPDDTYTVTLVSGVGSNGFQDVNGLGLDNGSGGHADVTSTITTTYQGSAMLGIADFARGPNAAADTTTLVKVPNKTGTGIPITLYKAAGVTGGSFTLTYNSQILTVTGGIGKLTMTTNVPSADGIHSVATFTFTGLTASSGAQVVGNVTAYVPNSAKTQYQVKDLLSLGNVTVTGSAATVLAGAGVDINAYLADVNGDHHIDALDKGFIANVASTSSTGFAAFTLMDPAIIADLANDNLVTSNSVSLINNYLLGQSVGEIPALAGIPDAQFVSPFSADPIVSLPAAVASSSNGLVSVPVLLDHPRPEGSTGLVEAELALTYDPSVLSLSASDITLGTIPGQGTGWELTSVVDAATGQIGIQLFSLTAITSAQAGSLVNITFHVLSGAVVPATAVQLVDTVTPHGQSFGTVLADAQAAMILTPGISRLEVMTGMAPLVVAPVSSSQVTATTVSGQLTVDGLVPNGSRDGAEATYLPISTELEEAAPLAVLSNGSVVGETATAHAVPAGVVVTGALAFQTTAIAATQLAGQTFQIGSTGWLSTLLASNILPSNPQQLAEQLFLALGRSTDAPVDLSTLSVESLNSLTWEAAPQATWLAAPAQGNAADTQTDSQAQQGAAIADRIATVDRIFADLANETDAFGDFGDN